MIRTKGEPGTGDVVQAVRHMRAMNSEIRRVQNLREDELYEAAKQLKVPVHLLRYVHDNGRLPVVNFAAGRRGRPRRMAALMMQLAQRESLLDLVSSSQAIRRNVRRRSCRQ